MHGIVCKLIIVIYFHSSLAWQGVPAFQHQQGLLTACALKKESIKDYTVTYMSDATSAYLLNTK